MSLHAPIAAAAELEPVQSESLAFLISGRSSGPGDTLVLSPEPDAPLGRAETLAVLASLRDDRPPMVVKSRRTRFARIVFGLREPAFYASERLNALRRYAVLYRIEGSSLSAGEEERLLDAGISARQAAAARALVDAHYTPDRDRVRLPWSFAAMIALAAAAAAFLYRWLTAQFDDSAGAFVVTILLATWVVSMAAVTAHPRARHT